MFLLDTNACIRLLNGTSAALAARVQGQSPSRIKICSIVKAELWFGARNSRAAGRNAALLEAFFAPLESLPFDDRCAAAYGAIRAHLQRAGKPIGGNDLLIAATAVANDVTLVTRNVREFRRVPELRVEDWETG